MEARLRSSSARPSTPSDAARLLSGVSSAHSCHVCRERRSFSATSSTPTYRGTVSVVPRRKGTSLWTTVAPLVEEDHVEDVDTVPRGDARAGVVLLAGVLEGARRRRRPPPAPPRASASSSPAARRRRRRPEGPRVRGAGHGADAHEAHPLVEGDRAVGGLRDEPAVGRLGRLEPVDHELDEPAAAPERAEQRELCDVRPDHALVVRVAGETSVISSRERAVGVDGERRGLADAAAVLTDDGGELLVDGGLAACGDLWSSRHSLVESHWNPRCHVVNVVHVT